MELADESLFNSLPPYNDESLFFDNDDGNFDDFGGGGETHAQPTTAMTGHNNKLPVEKQGKRFTTKRPQIAAGGFPLPVRKSRS